MGRGSSGASKGSRTLRPIFRKNTADSVQRLVNRQTEEINKLQALERGQPIAIAKAKDEISKIRVRREYNQKIKEQRAVVNELGRQIEEEIKNRAKLNGR